MTESYLVKTMQKRTTKLIVFFVALVGMMIFLVPAIVQESQARITATAVSQVGHFSDVKGEMFLGRFVSGPTVVGPTITWVTTSANNGGLNEMGVVSAKVAGVEVYFVFNNPAGGPNTCQRVVTPPGSIQATCHISQGTYASATFEVSNRNQGNDNNYCDILNNFGSEKTKAIREKLNC